VQMGGYQWITRFYRKEGPKNELTPPRGVKTGTEPTNSTLGGKKKKMI